MKKHVSLTLTLIFSLLTSSVAQNPAPAPQQNAPDQDDVVRISTNLVQVDAVVTDKSGKLVTDLRPEEIEIFEDNHPQKITNFSFISTESGTAQPVAINPAAPVDKTAPPPPPVHLKPEQVRRTIALVVDDLGLSFESTAYVRKALKKFIDEHVETGDMVAIIRTAGGMGVLQQFTSDKRQLYAAADRVKLDFRSRGSNVFAPLPGSSTSPRPGGQFSNNRIGVSEDIFTVGTLGALGYVVRGMRHLPGRKSILLMSDGITIFTAGDPSTGSRVLEAMQRLTDLANRSSVVIYTMDVRGLQTLDIPAQVLNIPRSINAGTPGLGTAMDPFGAGLDQRMGQLRGLGTDRRIDNRDTLFESQNGLNYLARQTGGFPILNTNDLTGGIRRVLDDQKGYYLIGYRPNESTFDATTGRRKFHRISIKVKRPGLSVRSRIGFYGITDEEAIPQRRTRAEQLTTALASPFTSGDVKVRLTSLYGYDPQVGSFVRSLLHIEARDLTFVDEPDGWHKAVFDVAAFTFGDNGIVVDRVDQIQTIRVRGESYKRVLENGFVYTLTVPIKRPGAYQLRTALRDTSSQRLGSAYQFIEVPDIANNRLALSGIAVIGTDPSAKPDATNGATDAPAQAGHEEVSGADSQAGPAVRRFRRGMMLNYGYVIYNAQVDKATARPQILTQMRLFRDGKPIFAGQVQSLDTSGQPDLNQLSVGGALQLGSDMTPGEYTLQVIVTDSLAKDKYRTATQWIDFEIVQ
ncbi:MAG TPA: VWA domain-containing protein [Pyrinomonadaceae bacterium]|nr:VWA domain-containing protein [Pyrinomonadaceae bacterium]